MIFGIGARSSVAERSAHNRLVAGSKPAEPTSEANPHEKSQDLYEKSQVLSELSQLRELLRILLDNKGGRYLELRQEILLKQIPE